MHLGGGLSHLALFYPEIGNLYQAFRKEFHITSYIICLFVFNDGIVLMTRQFTTASKQATIAFLLLPLLVPPPYK